MKRTVGIAVLLALLLGPGAAGQDEEDLLETVKVEDSQGVVTYATDFSKAFSGGYLSGFRGDSRVEIPFERVSVLRTGRIADSRMDVDLVLTTGRKLVIQLDRPEFESVYGGLTEFGNFRIRLQEVKSIEFHRLENFDESLGQQCSAGHIWYKETWQFCPYDGKALTPVRRPAEEPEEQRRR